ncbi:MAG: hypothetical protein ACYSYW_13850 [Planctomycetota bacterium]|jgi:hypothetical protein
MSKISVILQLMQMGPLGTRKEGSAHTVRAKMIYIIIPKELVLDNNSDNIVAGDTISVQK